MYLMVRMKLRLDSLLCVTHSCCAAFSICPDDSCFVVLRKIRYAKKGEGKNWLAVLWVPPLRCAASLSFHRPPVTAAFSSSDCSELLKNAYWSYLETSYFLQP